MDSNTNDKLKGWMADCARRDRVAFAALYDATSAKLFGVALRILKREDWAEEVLQDAYVNIWNNASSYAPALSAPMTWMTSIVRNRCLDWLRRPNPELVLEKDDGSDPMDDLPSGDEGPLEQLARSNDTAMLHRCLERLEARQRQAISLAFLQGLSHSELAQQMRQPLGTVKTWVRRGLLQLKACLSPNSGAA